MIDSAACPRGASKMSVRMCRWPSSSSRSPTRRVVPRMENPRAAARLATCSPMKQFGFSCAEVKAMGMVQGLKAAGYTCAEAKQAGFNPRECMQAGFTHQEGKAAGYPRWDNCWHEGQHPPRIEPRLTLAAARPPPPPPSARRGGPPQPPCRRAFGPRPLRAARRRGEPALPTHARSCAWRPRVAAQGIVTGMGTSFDR